MYIREGLLETQKIQLIQEQLCGFLLDEVIHPAGEFHVDASMLPATGDTDKTKENTPSIATGGQQSNDKYKNKDVEKEAGTSSKVTTRAQQRRGGSSSKGAQKD